MFTLDGGYRTRFDTITRVFIASASERHCLTHSQHALRAVHVETAELQRETLSRLREEKDALERQAMDIAVGLRDLEKAQEVRAPRPRGEWCASGS